jgi:hypothetical protein
VYIFWAYQILYNIFIFNLTYLHLHLIYSTIICHCRRSHYIIIIINKFIFWKTLIFLLTGLSWTWSYGSSIYNYLCNQCLSPLTLWVQIPLRRGVFDTTLCDKVCQWLSAGRWFSPVSSTNKTDLHDITEILLKVSLNTITLTHIFLLIIKI